jgi:hypothetical protein
LIFVECNPDEFVIKNIMGDMEIEIKHGGGKGNVLKKLRDGNQSIGIIDEDPHSAQPREMKKYVEKDARENAKLLRKADDESKVLIQLSPDIEGWLINRAQENEIPLKDYGLPEDRKRMHDIHHIERKEEFQMFVKRLIRTGDSEITAIRQWIIEAMDSHESG